MANNLKMKFYRVFSSKSTYIVGLVLFLISILNGFTYTAIFSLNEEGDFITGETINISYIFSNNLASTRLFFVIIFVLTIGAFKYKGYIKNIFANMCGLLSGTTVDVIVSYVIILFLLVFYGAGMFLGSIACLKWKDNSFKFEDPDRLLYRVLVFLLLQLVFILFMILMKRITSKQVALFVIMIGIVEFLPSIVSIINKVLQNKNIAEKPFIYEAFTGVNYLSECGLKDLGTLSICAVAYSVVLCLGIFLTNNKDQL